MEINKRSETAKSIRGNVVASKKRTDRNMPRASRSSQEQLNLLLNSFPNPIWRSGEDAKCFYFNQAWLDFTGRTLEQERGDGWAEGVHPDDFAKCLKTYLLAFKAKKPFRMKYRLKYNDGKYRLIDDFGMPFFDEQDIFKGYIGSCYDIESSYKKERQLEQLELIIKTSPLGILSFDKNLIVESWNLACEKIFGWTAAEVIGKPYPAIPPERRREAMNKFKNVLERGEVVEFETLRIKKDKTYCDIISHTAPIRDSQGSIVGIFALVEDISGKKRAEQNFLDATNLNQQIINNSPLGIFILNEKGEIEFVNDEMLRISNTPREKMSGFNLLESPTYKKIGLDILIKEAIRSKIQFKTGIIRYVSIFGKKETFRVFTGIPLLDKNGNFNKLLLAIDDQTEINQKNEEMETLNRLMIGRELKMIELKNKISELENKLASKK